MPAVLENCVDSSSFYAEIERRREASNRSALIGGAAVAGGASLFAIQTPAHADPITSITAMVTSVGTVAAGAVAVVLVALAARLGIKMVNRVMTKG